MTEPSTASGGCLCGAIRFVVEGEPYRAGLCHCLDCRKQGGAPFGAFVIFPADKVTVSGDEPGVFAGRRFCRSCGSPVFGLHTDGTAFLGGILWGSSTDLVTNEVQFIFSPFAAVERELGELTTTDPLVTGGKKTKKPK